MKARIAITVLALLSLCSVISTNAERKDPTTAMSFSGGGLPTPCHPILADFPCPPTLQK